MPCLPHLHLHQGFDQEPAPEGAFRGALSRCWQSPEPPGTLCSWASVSAALLPEDAQALGPPNERGDPPASEDARSPLWSPALTRPLVNSRLQALTGGTMFFKHTRPRCPRWMWNRPWAHIPQVSQAALAFPATAVEVLVWADAMVWRSAERAPGHRALGSHTKACFIHSRSWPRFKLCFIKCRESGFPLFHSTEKIPGLHKEQHSYSRIKQ